jgi:hypothetical protein
MKQNLGTCKQNDPHCVLLALKKKYRATILGRTFDEGEVCESEVKVGAKDGEKEPDVKCEQQEKFNKLRKKQKNISEKR